MGSALGFGWNCELSGSVLTVNNIPKRSKKIGVKFDAATRFSDKVICLSFFMAHRGLQAAGRINLIISSGAYRMTG